MAKVHINTQVLIWGIERSGKLEAELESKFPKLQAWIAGKDMPTYNQLVDLAKKTNVPFGYFFLSQPPEEVFPIPLFRTVKDASQSKPSSELLETVYAMQRRQTWLREYLIWNDNDKLDFIGSATIEDNPGRVADKIRKTLDLTENWAEQYRRWEDALVAFRHTIEQAGITIVANGVVENNTHRPLSVNEFRGFVLVDDYAPVIFVNNADSKAAQMFTLAHELAHLWLGSSAAFDLRAMQSSDDKTELLCNRVAAEFLIPTDIFQVAYEKADKNDQIFQVLARRFKVSELVIARRMQDCGFINRNEFLAFYEDYTKRLQDLPKRDDAGADFYKVQGLKIGHRFMQAVLHAVNDGLLQYTDAYRLTGLHGKTFSTFADNVMEKA